MVRAGHVVHSHVLKLTTEPCGVDVARLLEVGVGEEIVQLDRVRSVDGRPVQVVRAFMPAKLFPGLVEIDLSDRSLYQVLRERYGVRPTSGQRGIEAVALARPDSDHLGVPKGALGLRMSSTTRSSDNVVFEHFIAQYRGDSFRFELQIGPRSSL
jgi:GntR family transcriptional regulator